MRFLWRRLDSPSRVSSAIGIVAGVWSLFVILFAISQTLVHPSIGSPEQIFAILLFLLLFFVPPIFVLAGGLMLMTVEMSQDRRGILGFLVFVPAVLILFACSLITWGLLAHTLS